MLYTRTNPSPSRIHWSRNAMYSSCPAVSSTSSMHDWPSICTCLRYESSMVGSYVSTKWFKQSCGRGQFCLRRIQESERGAYLDGQGCLAHASIAEHDKLVQCHFARHGGWSSVGIRWGLEMGCLAIGVEGDELSCRDSGRRRGMSSQPRRRRVRLVRVRSQVMAGLAAVEAGWGWAARAAGVFWGGSSQLVRRHRQAAAGVSRIAAVCSETLGGGGAQGCTGLYDGRRRRRWTVQQTSAQKWLQKRAGTWLRRAARERVAERAVRQAERASNARDARTRSRARAGQQSALDAAVLWERAPVRVRVLAAPSPHVKS